MNFSRGCGLPWKNSRRRSRRRTLNWHRFRSGTAYRNNTEESITIQGDQAGLEEGTLALRKGAVVTELNLIYKSGNHEWRFSVKGESLHLSGLKTPQTGPVEKNEDMEGALLEKIFFYEKALALIHNLYKQFIRLRLSPKWKKEGIPQIRKWILSQQRTRT